jgi:hypothetical protein
MIRRETASNPDEAEIRMSSAAEDVHSPGKTFEYLLIFGHT